MDILNKPAPMEIKYVRDNNAPYMNKTPDKACPDILPTGHLADRTPCRTDTLPTGHLAGRTSCLPDILPTGHLADRTSCRPDNLPTDILPTGPNKIILILPNQYDVPINFR